ncbi:MAG: carbon-nitrogen hydrolase family protein [Deltaproteobacteria bacterium]|nr:carbon-nitrogen hydrolase family protein [Deltaproteobacteria bacterium]
MNNPCLKMAVYQGAGTPGDVTANLEQMTAAIRQAARQDVQLIVFPELFLCGYNLGAEVLQRAQPARGPAAEHLARVARESGTSVLYGYAELETGAEGQTIIYNSAQWISAATEPWENYRKAHLYGPEEKRWFQPGNELRVVDLHGVRMGVLICYDVEFPEAVRALAMAGAHLIAVPTALMHSYAFVPNTLVPTRAWENQVFVAYANHCGVERGLGYAGRSCIMAPDGTELARADGAPTLLVAEIRPADYQRSRQENPYLSERRPQLYTQVSQRSAGPERSPTPEQGTLHER